ncbi:MAG TPA: ABC transporter permease [Longimicrobiales bacterium]|nr:ABC transporter permease [Longimicrobiales bacterium]
MTPPAFRRVFRNPFRAGHLEREVEEEHRVHLEEKTRALVARGIDPDEARRRAVADFGPRRRWRREALRERRRGYGRMRRAQMGDAWGSDLLASARQLRRHPGFTLFTTGVLALGVGFGVAVLASVDAVLFRPLPYAEPDRVVWLRGVMGEVDEWGVSPANWLDWQDMQRSFAPTAATRAVNTSLLEGGAEYVPTLRVESAFFRILGVSPHVGRLLDEEDDADDAPLVAVLTHSLWVGRFGADPDLLGRELTFGGRAATVVGILPPSFEYLDVPIWGGPERRVFMNDVYGGDRTSRWSGGYFWPLGLLREGVTLEQAQRDMDGIAVALAEAYPEINGEGSQMGSLGIKVTPLRHAVTREARGGVLLLGGFVLLLILVVCGNVAGLFLARTVDRGRELAIRASLGADRLRLARETLSQVALVTLLGGAAGLAIAGVIMRVIHRIAPPDVAFLDGARIDGRVALGSAALALAMWAVAGVLPALRAGGVDLYATLKTGAGSGPRSGSSAGRAVIVVQLGLATTLVTGAGILLGTYASMTAVEPGVRVQDVRVLRYRLPTARYASAAGVLTDYPEVTFLNDAWAEQSASTRVYRVGDEARAFVERAVSALERLSGVRGVAVANHPPLWGDGAGGYGVGAVDPDERAVQSPSAGRYRLKWVSPGYFEVLGIPLLRGRAPERGDHVGAGPVAVVNQAFVDTYLADEPEPIGRVVEVPESGSFPARLVTIVGVVGDVLHRNPSQPRRAAMYVPIAQRGELWDEHQVAFPLYATLMVRTEADADVDEMALRAAISELDPGLVIQTSTTLETLHAELYRETRFWLALLTSFGGVALLLAAAGTFALLTQAVRLRTREIGIRRALGASTGNVLGQVMKDAVTLTAAGLVLGLAASWYLSRLLASQVVGVEGMELGSALVVVGVLLAAAVAASWGPARWASRVVPVEALRAD